eukprot:TRINITY_DN12923_c0_g2_i2.p1 TRINITY_DN12923_c0_g2~~TRINITY_DN12923_c0_g2_i2.p1  ORF type:complete len:213 (-),score=53.09 TRINITY_DN12923_c0_g2_i2:299-937(-)
MASQNGKQLPFLAVGRVKDSKPLAMKRVTDEVDVEQQKGQAVEDIFKKLLGAAQTKLKPGQRTRLQWNDGSVCCMLDSTGLLLFCLLTSSMEYPEQVAFALLQELNTKVSELNVDVETATENGLDQELGHKMEELLANYEHRTEAHRYTTSIMSNQRMSQKDAAFRGSQGGFQMDGREVAQEDKMKRYLIIGGLVACFLLLCYLMFFHTKSA